MSDHRKRPSPTRETKADYAAALKEQMSWHSGARREVVDKIGSRRRTSNSFHLHRSKDDAVGELAGLGLPSEVAHHPPPPGPGPLDGEKFSSMRKRDPNAPPPFTGGARPDRAGGELPSVPAGPFHRRRPADETEQMASMRRSRELGDALAAQIREQEAAKLESYRRERLRSRELAAARSGAFGRVEHSMVYGGDGGGDEADVVVGDHTTEDESAAAMMAGGGGGASGGSGIRYGRRASTRMSPELPFGVVAIPASVIKEDPGAGPVMSRVSPLREVPTTRHISPERLRQSSHELLSSDKLFDLQRREQQELLRKHELARQQEDLRRDLELQIEQKRRRAADAVARERALDLEMERRAMREAREMAERDARRDEEEKRQAEEAERANREAMARRHTVHVPAPDPPSLPRRRGDTPSVPGTPLADVSPVGRGDVSGLATQAQVAEIIASLTAIRDELTGVTSRSLPPAGPPSPSPPGPSPPPGHRLTMSIDRNRQHMDEADAVLERNRARLNALRYADHHDDILKAFLLQDSTAAMRAVSQYKARNAVYESSSLGL